MSGVGLFQAWCCFGWFWVICALGLRWVLIGWVVLGWAGLWVFFDVVCGLLCGAWVFCRKMSV